jgi:hypothetical protein
VPVSVPVLTMVGTAAGAAAAVVAYQAGAGVGGESASTPEKDTSATVQSAPDPAPAPARTTWLPCEKGTKLHHTKLHGGVCVRIRQKVVIVNDPAPVAPAYTTVTAPAVSAGQAAPARRARSGRGEGPREHARGGDRNQAEPAGEVEHADENGDDNEPDNEPDNERGHDD